MPSVNCGGGQAVHERQQEQTPMLVHRLLLESDSEILQSDLDKLQKAGVAFVPYFLFISCQCCDLKFALVKKVRPAGLEESLTCPMVP